MIRQPRCAESLTNLSPNVHSSSAILPGLRVLDDREPHNAALNMAIDEALLAAAAFPILRFYRWREPSLSFGYFGRYAEAAAAAAGARDMVRRWTGGGIVLHGADLTYSIIWPRGGAALPPPSIAYRQIHGALREALADNPAIALAHENAPRVSDACFANAVAADVLADGRKIAGAAQRRTRAGLLHQGSIQYERLPGDFPRAFAARLCLDFSPTGLDDSILLRAHDLAAVKYGAETWLRRR